MELSDKRVKTITRRILFSRLRLLASNGFYGQLLMNMKISLSSSCETAEAEGERLYLNPEFAEGLADKELDYVLMHEILHVALQHGRRLGKRENERFWHACDIVVNSNILRSCGMSKSGIMLEGFGGVQPHLAPDGKEGCNYTAEEVYNMLTSTEYRAEEGEKGQKRKLGWDRHDRLEGKEDPQKAAQLSLKWLELVEQAAQNEKARQRGGAETAGSMPMLMERLLMEMKRPQLDWRTILNEFVQQDIMDYTFMPPDRRFDSSPFFLPDLNDIPDDGEPADILFMADTSASMSKEQITGVYSEINGAIMQFGGSLKGWLGFFDAEVVPPVPFSDSRSLRLIRPKGGGGTRFDIIFEYIFENMAEHLPVCIIIMTDGYADFPDEKAARGIPVLWLINNDSVMPPWGKTARIP